MIKATVVIGANYGDEGKGQTVHAFSDASSCVVRFNGGAQAGHTVVDGNLRHVFHQMGSGSMRGASTFLSKEYIVNPFIHPYERNFFPTNRIYVDERCRLSTLTDIVINQMVEDHRQKRHGSCGMGINETITRHSSRTQLEFRHIRDKDFPEKLEHIWNVDGPDRLTELGFPELIPAYFKTLTRDMIKASVHDSDAMFRDVITVCGLTEMTVMCEDLVFEGAQGLLLSERQMQWYPHLTRSDTGIGNVVTLLNELTPADYPELVDVQYVTRPYLTRHGAGPLRREIHQEPFASVVDETNVPNPFQGTIRYALLDVDELMHFLDDDIQRGSRNIENTLRVTCWDQLPEFVHFFYNNTLQAATPETFYTILQHEFMHGDVTTTGFTK